MRRPLVFALVMMLGTAAAWADDIADCDQIKNLDLKIRGCSKLIKLSPNDATAYNNRGGAYYRKGDKEQAIADFRKALEIDPSYQKAKIILKALGVTP
jgi:tetratricopeptide (TPR) repeat protein